MEINVSEIKSVKEIIMSAKKVADEECLEELRICHPAVSVIIKYGKSNRSIFIELLNKKRNMIWENGKISIDEITAFLDEK